MNSVFKVCMALLLLFFVSACVTTSPEIPQKYMFDGQLEKVSKVQDVRLGRLQPAQTVFNPTRATNSSNTPGPTYSNSGQYYEDADIVEIMNKRDILTLSETASEWEKVDTQSLIIKSTNSEYFLLIFNRPVPFLLSQEAISFNLHSNTLNAGSDFLEMEGTKFLIERIYKIEGRDKMFAVKNQLKSSGE